MKYVYVQKHAGQLAGGATVEPGATVELNKEQEQLAHNQRLIRLGCLQALPEKKAAKASEAKEEKAPAKPKAAAKQTKKSEEVAGGSSNE